MPKDYIAIHSLDDSLPSEIAERFDLRPHYHKLTKQDTDQLSSNPADDVKDSARTVIEAKKAGREQVHIVLSA